MGGAPWEHVSRDFCQADHLITLLRGCFAFAKTRRAERESLSETYYEKMFLYCVTWSLEEHAAGV